MTVQVHSITGAATDLGMALGLSAIFVYEGYKALGRDDPAGGFLRFGMGLLFPAVLWYESNVAWWVGAASVAVVLFVEGWLIRRMLL
jgi:hypothetical protein